MKIITKFKLFEQITSRAELLSNSIKKDGLVEPALMTSEEYIKYLGANKHHPETAYQFSLMDDPSNITDDILNDGYSLLNTIKHGSIYIKYYVDNGNDFKNNQYVKLDEDGEIMRDERGMAISMTRNEIDSAGYTYDRNIIAVHNNKIVGSAQDEWGCVLIYVVKELMGIGIGQQLTRFYRSYYPNKTSGGTTPSGYKNLRKYHAEQIKSYSRNGIYSEMVRNKEISYNRVKNIIDSISSIKLNNKNKQENIYSKYFNDLKSYNRAFLFGGNDVMLINDNILEYYKDYDKDYNKIEDTYENFIHGHCRLHNEDNGEIRLYFLDGKSDKDLSDLIEYSLSFIKSKYNKTSLLYYITENTSDNTKSFILKNYENTLFDNNKYRISSSNIQDQDTRKYLEYLKDLKEGTIWFYSLDDKHGEIKARISENVYSTFDN